LRCIQANGDLRAMINNLEVLSLLALPVQKYLLY
jgi:hypothetical protein